MAVRNFWKNAVKHKGEKTHLEPERAEALKELADALKVYPQYSRAIKLYAQFSRGGAICKA